jgi:hypothetical protein
MGRVEAHVAPGDDVEGLFNLHASLPDHAVMIFKIITHERTWCFTEWAANKLKTGRRGYRSNKCKGKTAYAGR